MTRTSGYAICPNQQAKWWTNLSENASENVSVVHSWIIFIY